MTRAIEFFLALILMHAVGWWGGYAWRNDEVRVLRAQCSQAVGQLERSVGLSRECVATLQDAADLLQTATRRPLVGARSDYVAQNGVR